MPFSFSTSHSAGRARAGLFVTPHGPIETPAFMPVGTLATVKAIDPADLRAMRAQMILSNAYHLHLRPGDELVRQMGGLHAFMGWDGPVLTDSGGFQVFSLAGLRTIAEDGVEFRSHIDGSRRQFTPESVMRIERNLGADVIMQFDHVVPGQSERGLASEAMERSVRWLARCLTEFERLRAVATIAGPDAARPAAEGGGAASGRAKADASAAAVGEPLLGPSPMRGGPPTGTLTPDAHESRTRPPRGVPPNFDPEQTLFPIVQGGIHADLRRASAAAIAGMHAWQGFGIGGLSVGEAKPDMYAMLEVVDEALPGDRPRYLMGVGFPEDLVEGVRRGVDLFDCVAPTRMGRNGTVFTADGRLNIKRAEFRDDPRPIDETCGCPACLRFSRAYVRHLFVADEIFGLRLLSLHNVHFLVSLMHDARRALIGGTFDAWSTAWLERYHSRTG